ncbi:hypothetical protein AX769_05945 [Frondihabitans sp. PAMC 28766]|uniref:PulJ/GspJ family protein n=1 Tax=Frondihabitans sp. PAMC 28766 TaxID=1795630 RepID=UPI00078BDAB7|nr:prepilin-type N-terminal cleavage/methylation domain-containing protein [Frondihabitans sp. PAMC 28766]AMM19775.1 hypothetical protein AX769_05945 [Frondihabitans sp. PAMC 28766]
MIARLRTRVAQISAPNRQDLGLSLTELLVAMAIFSILLVMMVGFFTSASRANQYDHVIDTSNRVASSGMNEVARMIRGATTLPVNGQTTNTPAFVSAGANSITLYTSINLAGTTASTEMVTIAPDASGNLVESVYQPVVSNGFFTFGSAPTTTRTIASPVLLPAAGGPALFSYVDTTGASIALNSSGVVASVQSIAAVTVNLQIGTGASSAQSTLLTNTVGLPNLQIARSPSS